MLESVVSGLKSIAEKLKGEERFTEENLAEPLEFTKKLLIDSDVNYKFVKNFLSDVKEDLLGKKFVSGENKVTPGEYFLATCKRQLSDRLSRLPVDFEKKFQNQPTKILLVGLQGVGKTTQAGKLALQFQKIYKKRTCLVACDHQRPAAAEQLKTLSERVECGFVDLENQDPFATVRSALEKKNEFDCFLFDTAGRLSIDKDLMNQLHQIKKEVEPDQTILVLDSLMGQQAVKIGEDFQSQIGVDGVILTKFDADGKGGAALSLLAYLDLPVYFLGMGESLEDLSSFDSDRLLDRIFGSPDVKGLIESAQKMVDEEMAQDLEQMMEVPLNFSRFLKLTKLMKRFGRGNSFLSHFGLAKKDISEIGASSHLFYKDYEALYHSMTPLERENPLLVISSPTSKSRTRRISAGAGVRLASTQATWESFSFFLRSLDFMKKVSKLEKQGLPIESMSLDDLARLKSKVEKNPAKKKKKNKKDKYKNR